MRGLLKPRPGESLSDVGCGTGYLTRCFARDQAAAVAGVDPDPVSITAMCFVQDQVTFLREMARVTQR